MRRAMRNGIRKIAAFIRVKDNKRGVDAETCPQLRGKGDGMIADPAARGLEPRNNLNDLAISGHLHTGFALFRIASKSVQPGGLLVRIDIPA